MTLNQRTISSRHDALRQQDSARTIYRASAVPRDACHAVSREACGACGPCDDEGAARAGRLICRLSCLSGVCLGFFDCSFFINSGRGPASLRPGAPAIRSRQRCLLAPARLLCRSLPAAWLCRSALPAPCGASWCSCGVLRTGTAIAEVISKESTSRRTHARRIHSSCVCPFLLLGGAARRRGARQSI